MLKNTVVFFSQGSFLPAKAVQSTTGLFEGKDHIEGGDGLPAAMLSVSHSIADKVL